MLYQDLFLGQMRDTLVFTNFLSPWMIGSFQKIYFLFYVYFLGGEGKGYMTIYDGTFFTLMMRCL
jgi:hypothetical protein